MRGEERLQRAITRQVEQVQRDALHADSDALPRGDVRRLAWFSVGVGSSQWVTAHPTHDFDFSPEEFREVATTYYGLPSPACCQPGTFQCTIPTSVTRHGVRVVDSHICEETGLLLGRLSLPIVTWDMVHDECQAICESLLDDGRVPYTPEPRYMFRRLIPAAVLNDRTNPPGIIPDFHADLAMPPAIDRAPAQGRPLRYPHWSRDALPTRRLLFDVKTVYGGGTYYLGAWAARHQTGAVEARALAVSPAYEAHARELDEQYSRPQVRIQGPDGTWQSVPDASQPAGDGIRRLLGSFTRVRGLVFGQYGEWSLDVSHLISISAARAAARGWRQTGFRSEAEYRGMLTGMLRRRVGLQVVRAFARQRLRRVGLVGIPRTEIDGWRERQQRDRTLGSRGSDALVRLSDVLAYAAEYRAHTPHGVMP